MNLDHETHKAVAQAINAELKPKPATRTPEVKRYSGTAPNGDRVVAIVTYGDACGNGHNTLSITGTVWYAEQNKYIATASPSQKRERAREGDASGCVHDDIARAIPELCDLLKWHLCSTDGPIHYLDNTVHHAGDRDCHGLRKGEVRQIRNGRTGLPAWKLAAFVDGQEVPLYSLEKYPDSQTCPPCSATLCYVPWNREGEGKARELDHARSAAVWPEATDAQLMAEPADLRAALLARLPLLMREFKAAVESLGFTY